MNEQSSDGFGNLPNASANFGNVPQGAEGFGTIPHDAESFRTLRNAAERTEQHTLTVREVARLFEQAGVPRTERSIVNWCQPNHRGVARLDAFFDTNERKYFITPQSVTAAIGEEQAKQAANGKSADVAPTGHDVRQGAEPSSNATTGDGDSEPPRELELKLRDLEITNRVKDKHIEMLEKERDRFADERQNYIERLISTSREVGEMRSQLALLGSASAMETGRLSLHSETRESNPQDVQTSMTNRNDHTAVSND